MTKKTAREAQRADVRMTMAPAAPDPWAELARLPFPEGFPAPDATTRLIEEQFFQRAVQVAILTLPIVSFLAMRDGLAARFGAGHQVLPIWKRRMDARCKLPGARPDVVAALGFLDLAKDGPLVVSLPAGVQGGLSDAWQHSITDLGPAGPDEGKGGLYLVLPPGHQGYVPHGYHTFRASSHDVALSLHAFLEPGEEGPDPARAVEALERTRVFPMFSRNVDRLSMRFPDASGQEVGLLVPRDASCFDKLAAFVHREPVELVEGVLRGMMASLGIKRTATFEPDARRREILARGAEVAPRLLMAMRVGGAFPDEPFYRDRQWLNLYGWADDRCQAVDHTAIDARGYLFLVDHLPCPATGAPLVGLGSKCPVALRDAGGDLLSGGRSYRLRLPAHIPVRHGWSLALHGVPDGALLDNGQPFPALGSLDRPRQEPDGSHVVFIGPEAPSGQGNWLRTVPGQGFSVVLRLHGPTQAFFDQAWRPGDLERL